MVPQWRLQKPTIDHPMSEQHILKVLKYQETLVLTPSRRIENRNICCYDDRLVS